MNTSFASDNTVDARHINRRTKAYNPSIPDVIYMKRLTDISEVRTESLGYISSEQNTRIGDIRSSLICDIPKTQFAVRWLVWNDSDCVLSKVQGSAFRYSEIVIII
ncbi:hypothetical protein JTB14_038030 [Gonioctena quinquepunctata]|nr:hypothetical protein JTB14_038030 [Gonioctena quinquepunctata]